MHWKGNAFTGLHRNYLQCVPTNPNIPTVLISNVLLRPLICPSSPSAQLQQLADTEHPSAPMPFTISRTCRKPPNCVAFRIRAYHWFCSYLPFQLEILWSLWISYGSKKPWPSHWIFCNFYTFILLFLMYNAPELHGVTLYDCNCWSPLIELVVEYFIHH